MTDSTSIRPFHLAFPVQDLKETEIWYTTILGCTTGRKSDKWIDFNFFGHQLVAHLVKKKDDKMQSNMVDGDQVPSRHFGIVMEMLEWDAFVGELKSKKMDFLIQPQVRFKGEVGEQATFFILDPFNNALEFKAFQNDGHIFNA